MKMKNALAVLCLTLTFAACEKEKDVKNDVDETLILAIGSTVKWKGYLETGYFNSGTIQLDAHDLQLSGDKVTGGDIIIPVSSIIITNDLSAEDKVHLSDHLKSPDFFDMAIHPNVTYSISAAEKTGKTDAQGNNYVIKGSLKLLGKSLPLDIPAKIHISKTEVNVVSTFKFDRTKWGMTFASDPGLPAEDKIKNDIEVELDLKATRTLGTLSTSQAKLRIQPYEQGD